MAAALRMTLDGDRAMKRKLESMVRKFPVAVRRGTRIVAEQKLAITQDRVPVKTGKLKSTGKVRISLRKVLGDENISATIVYGGSGVLYARRVHENLTARHKGGGRAKYVESVLMESVSSIGADLARAIDLKRVAMEAK